MKTNKLVVLLIIALTVLASCSSDSNEPTAPKGDYDNGIIVTNEGDFTGGTGTINYISNDYTAEEAKVYEKVNNETLGTIVQSIGFDENRAYIVVNVANKISITDRYTMEKLGEISTDLSNPRFIAFANGKGYVTNWGDGGSTDDDYVAVIDLDTNSVTNKITVAEGPERIIANGNKLYVSHKGGWGVGNSVSVLDATSDSVVANITVGIAPDELFFNSNGSLMVSCEGQAASTWNPTEVLAEISVISTGSNTVTKTIEVPTEVHPNTMVKEDGKIYFSSEGKVYEMSESASTYNATELFSTPVYGMNVREGKLYITDAKDYVSNGSLKVFDISTKAEEKEFTVGINPGKIYFN
ncbi:YVTN family beta-propeller protein [Tenacibaculum adriaticum]|uniref:YVTN family beta-propeller protein n=1 Tax=Tenacibaculum adriaticum TaxID=413713 RepID=A0A5S5DTI6_9FLAO|nr:DUF5074 domain-containing protein [Tenacibaculum adriaticum]TYP99187.1 YVTN family beta-propeller protein [Tenacibaculum adriaticum]